MSGKAIVLDANILIRAVLGKRVRELIFDNAGRFQARSATRLMESVAQLRACKAKPYTLKNAGNIRSKPPTSQSHRERYGVN